MRASSSSTPAARPGAIRQFRSSCRRRSEEHTSELQSLMRISYAVFCLKKKNNTSRTTIQYHDHHNTHDFSYYTNITRKIHHIQQDYNNTFHNMIGSQQR